MKAALGILLTALLLGACGSHEHTVDTKAWRADLADQGVKVVNWDKYQSVWVSECAKNQSDLGLFLTLKGVSEPEVRTAFKYQCPDQLDKLDKAYASVNDATSNADEACQTPKEQRTDEQEQLAEAMGC